MRVREIFILLTFPASRGCLHFLTHDPLPSFTLSVSKSLSTSAKSLLQRQVMHIITVGVTMWITLMEGWTFFLPQNSLRQQWKWKSINCVHSLQSFGLYSPWNSPGQNTGVGSLSLLQGIFPTQGLNPALPHCRWILYQLSYQGSPWLLEWVAYPFSRGSS